MTMVTTDIREEGGNGIRSRENFMQEGGLKSERNLAREEDGKDGIPGKGPVVAMRRRHE